MRVTGKGSLTQMSLSELSDLLNHLNRSGKPDTEWGFVFRLIPDRRLLAQKIYRQAQRIGGLQNPAVAVMSKAYIEGIARQMRGCEQPLEFCDSEQLHKIVQALEIFIRRNGGRDGQTI